MISNDGHQNFGKFCGQKTGESIVVTGHYVLITFHSDSIERRKGFRITFISFCESNTANDLKVTIQWQEKPRPTTQKQCYKIPFTMKINLLVNFCQKFGVSFILKKKNSFLAVWK